MEGHSTKSLLRVISLALALSLAVPLITPAAHAEAASPTTVYLPNVTKMLGGPDGWQTPFIVQNVGAAPTDLTVSFYSFADGSLVAQRHVTGLMPGTSYADVPNNDADLPAGGQFSVVVQSSAAGGAWTELRSVVPGAFHFSVKPKVTTQYRLATADDAVAPVRIRVQAATVK